MHFKKFLKILMLFVFIPAAYLLINMAYSSYILYEAVEVTKDNLEKRNGVFYIARTNKLFNGFAYSTACGGECGFPGSPALHWYGEFKNGLKDGEHYMPTSSGHNDYFFMYIFSHYKVHYYSAGKEISHNKLFKNAMQGMAQIIKRSLCLQLISV